MEKTLALALLIASIAVLAYLALTLLPQAVAPRVAYVKVEEEGRGRVLVNGSRALSLKARVPATLRFKALPEPGWRLSKWLVNGSSRGGGALLTLRVRGNTSVRASSRG